MPRLVTRAARQPAATADVVIAPAPAAIVTTTTTATTTAHALAARPARARSVPEQPVDVGFRFGRQRVAHVLTLP